MMIIQNALWADDFPEKVLQLNLLRYVSGCVALFQLHESVKRVMEFCIVTGIPINWNVQ